MSAKCIFSAAVVTALLSKNWSTRTLFSTCNDVTKFIRTQRMRFLTILLERVRSLLSLDDPSYPTHTTVPSVKHILSEVIECGKICLGKQVAPREFTVFQLNRKNKTVIERKITFQGRMISLADSRKKILLKHHSIGVMLRSILCSTRA